MPNALTSFVRWLSERRDFLRNLENEAIRVLREDENPDKYRALMCQKAQFLEELPEEAEKHMRGIHDDDAAFVAKRLSKFSRNASQALELDSVFYMYALLYPENHQEGDPNDLDTFVAELAEKAKA